MDAPDVKNQDLEDARSLLSARGSGTDVGAAFSVNPDQLSALVDPKNPWILEALGGVDGLSRILVTDLGSGLSDAQLTEAELSLRSQQYGRNVLPEKKMNGLFKIMLMTLDDKVLIILIIAALISLALGLYETLGEPPEYYRDGTKIPSVDWVEGVAILAAVIIVTVVGSINDWQKERQFAKLSRKKEHRLIEVVRNGSQQQVAVEEVTVGDIILVQPGDILAVDGVTLESNDIECDESSVTGEFDTMRKFAATEALKTLNRTGKTKNADCVMISGAKVLQGTGRYVVTAVGRESMWGRTMVSLHEGTEVTPLQEKLNRIADGIAKFGVWSALVLFIVLFIRFCIQISGNGMLSQLNGSLKGNHFMDIFIVSITIIVVAVPEGLPLAVTLALAFATTRMVKDNCLVRVLKSCETMGGATSVCSDKTGTLTQNKMTVVKFLLNMEPWELATDNAADESTEVHTASDRGCDHYSSSPTQKKMARVGPFSVGDDLSEDNVRYSLQGQQRGVATSEDGSEDLFGVLVRDSICLNSTVYEDHNDQINLLGSKTEVALVNLARAEFGLPVGSLQHYREERPPTFVLPFDSTRKFMLTITKLGENHYRMLIKGAAEIIIKLSSSALQNGQVFDIDDRILTGITCAIDEYADEALRCISIAYKDFTLTREVDWSSINPENLEIENFCFIGLLGIKDPLRPGVREAVKQCRRAGVVVRMVTGDNMRTAKAIAKNACIIPENPGKDVVIMEGPRFRELSDSEALKIAPNILILARSSPQDKRRLVELLKSVGETVAVTGDGTNDAPALRLADVGFSMGISGTEVAKEASDIIIMDDNFASIVNALRWGRTVNDAVKKFLQFQLTVNVTAVTLTFVSAVASSSNESVLTAVQLLWVNLIMDTLAALALATDTPTDSVLDRMPDNRQKSLITPTMWKMIFGQSIFQLCVTFVLHFAGKQLFAYPEDLSPRDETRLSSMVFNAFVWMQFFNMFVNRRLDNKQNLFVGIMKNPFFSAIVVIIGGFQVLIMFVGGTAFHIQRSTGAMWATAIICGAFSIPMGMLTRLVPDSWVLMLFPRRAWNIFMKCLDAVEAVFLWLMTPFTWALGLIARGFKNLLKVKGDSDQDKEETKHPYTIEGVERHDHLVERHLFSEKENQQGPVSSNYHWIPGIEKSMVELSFLRKVRGGRSRQLNFLAKAPEPKIKESRPRISMHSTGSAVSTLAAFMAPMVVGGAVGGWAPQPNSLAKRS